MPAFGECSSEVHHLAMTLAEIGSHLHYESMHVATPAIAKSVLVSMIRRDWGLAAVKANANAILSNLRHVGVNVAAAGHRRAAQEKAWGTG